MKNYLNKEEQAKMTVLFCLQAEMEQMLEAWNERGNLTEAEADKLQTAAMTLSEALQMIFSRLPLEQQRRVYRSAKGNRILMRPRLSGALARAEMEREVQEENEAGAFIPTETVENIADVVLYNCCNPCKLDGCDRKTCKAREVLICLDVPMFDENASGDKCPYDNGGNEE